LWPVDTSISKFLWLDDIFSVVKLSATSPVPVQSSNILESCDFLISQVGNNLEHFTSVTVMTEDFVIGENMLVNNLLQKETSYYKATYNPFSLFSVI